METAIAIIVTGIIVAVVVGTIKANGLDDLADEQKSTNRKLDQIGVIMGQNQEKVDEYVAQVDKIHTEISNEFAGLRAEIEAVKAQLEDANVDFTALDEKLDNLDAIVEDAVVEPPVVEEPTEEPVEEPPVEEPVEEPTEEPSEELPPVEEIPPVDTGEPVDNTEEDLF